MILADLFESQNTIIDNRLTTKSLSDAMRLFLEIAREELALDQLPTIRWKTTSKVGPHSNSFGRFIDHEETIEVVIRNRHPIDIMRTLAHELVHYGQFVQGKIRPESGETGSPIENEANAMAGKIMRRFDDENPGAFDLGPVAPGS